VTYLSLSRWTPFSALFFFFSFFFLCFSQTRFLTANGTVPANQFPTTCLQLFHCEQKMSMQTASLWRSFGWDRSLLYH
jgi:hypothetical protein